MNEGFKPIQGPVDATRSTFEVAAGWHGVIAEGEPDAAVRERFEAWLHADPSNRAAYVSVERAWAGMAHAGVDDRILAMRREALGARRTARRGWIRPAALAASIVVGVTLVVAILIHREPKSGNPSAGEYATQVGQQSRITLSDGSIVMLNTASRIRLAFDPARRRVELLAGQAWFEVAKNQPRPFIVEAGDRTITAHGTAFDVRLEDHERVQVTLIEGRISVEALESSGVGPNIATEHEDLLPGDQLVATATGLATKRKVDLAKATSWRKGKIIFDNDTLANAVAEVNRYMTEKIVLADPRLGSLRMSGVFIAGHRDSFLETVAGHFRIKVSNGDDGRIVLTAAN